MLWKYCGRLSLQGCSLPITTCYKFSPVLLNRYHYCTNSRTDPDTVQVYYGILTPQIRAVKVLSLSTSFIGIASQPILVKEISSLGGLPLMIAAFGFVGFFTFVTPLLLHLITRKYVTEIKYNLTTGMYTATVLSFFLRRKLIMFKPDDVTVPHVGGMFTTFKVGGVPLFVEPRLFDDPGHYAKIMGYDKPIDFKLESTVSSVRKDGK